MAIHDLFDAAMTFPAAPFTFLTVAVIVYWLLVMVGGSTPPTSGGVPLNITGSVFIVLAWLALLTGTMVHDPDVAADPPGLAASVLILAVSLAVAALGTALLARPIRHLLRPGRPADPARLVGSICVVRTGEVGPDTGQAEVTGADGTPVVIEVRHDGVEELRPGNTALIDDYDAEHGVFWVTAFHPKLGTTP
ncbi:hypothetical protein [Jiangella anatolica]|uniref:DUF1449 domain-containing protein n=1 Tax=Jiangella anatolica TaxID=2670374 RepID=A0A2W2BWV5_9ACTN|nr:hypothetical protein [Jiangella anatolica]PZF84428.1 hypothetical protein C1I92_08340 [Jiangella anatolica]